MRGPGPGRRSNRPLVEHGLLLDLSRLLRNGIVREGCCGSRSIRFVRNGSHAGAVRLSFDLTDIYEASLNLNYMRRFGDGQVVSVSQSFRLTHTLPTFGGRRWWIICPDTGCRIGKLYLPDGGDRFGSRVAWDSAYRSQRQDARQRTFSRLHRLQRKLGCDERIGVQPLRPPGMWRRTFERHLAEYERLNDRCAAIMEDALEEVHGFCS